MSFAPSASQEMSALIYGAHHPGTLDFLERQYDDIDSYVTSAGRDFMQQSRRDQQFFQSSVYLNFARSVNNKYANTKARNTVKLFSSMDEFQKADEHMQRWIMANPSTRERWQKQRCEGYIDTYIDHFPGVVGEAHYDYRRATDGLMEFSEDGQDVVFTEYGDTLLDDDSAIPDFSDQVKIKHTWIVLELLNALGERDPTSKSNTSL